MSSKNDRFDGAIVTATDETTPLIAVQAGPFAEPVDPSSELTSTDGAHADDENAPLPKGQIFLLCYTRVIEPIAFFSIFPYINSMIEHVGGIEIEDVGFYSGLIESLFSFTQMCVMIFWGKASDRYGRKPVLVLSLLGIAVATTLFGMSQSIAQMIVARCLAGVFAGTVVTLRAMFSENSTKNTQARAFSYFAFAGNMGIFLGPLLGAAFERPAEKYPRVFGNELFRKYPYLLPGLAVSVLTLTSALTTMLFVKETLHTHKDKKKTTEAPLTMWQLVNAPGVARVILIFEYVGVLAFTFTAVNPVNLHTFVHLGGIGFSDELIAAVIGFSGLSQAAWLLLVFPALHKHIGTGQVLRLTAWVWPVFFAVNPLFNLLLRHGHKIAFWVIAPPCLALGSGVAMAFTAVQLAINDIAPSHETFGTLNAITLALSSGARAVAPALATSVYATGVKYRILGGQLFWVLNVILALGLIGLCGLLPEKAEGRPKKAEPQAA
ncbi:MFS general substrate transporter [Didymella exigua CBS 183.55]|uniref:MFS general substrate transporter n=1 Tax=Didymella exigua CBS 183.55 TaxID=1150837 RepID=A0A6A5RGG8_9PLEO|nr:MFS general substrate transporter [Didymella exigua CBS 183.55]KAF1926842.1 MFS general substrate transporter [Didymella exigua CBS 183.55]